jgi:hypothetical protein
MAWSIGMEVAIIYIEVGKNMIGVSEKNMVVKQALDAAIKLNALADQVEDQCSDNGCYVVCGVIRDCAHKIKGTAEREIELHRRQGFSEKQARE